MTLTMRRDLVDACSQAAHADLLRDVFGIAEQPSRTGPTWRPLAYFDEQGRCVATLERGDLTLALAEGPRQAAGLRLVGVAETWRGRGLFRALMEHAIADCAERGVDLILLFTADPALYHRFGFQPVPQHAFTGKPPEAIVATPARTLRLGRDQALVDRVLAGRAPVSEHVALIDAPSLFLERVGSDDGLLLAHLPDEDALVVYELVDDTLILVDIAARTMPSLAQVLGALPGGFARVMTLFPPDKLAWPAALPIAEDTGLMARGPLPAAMRQPFMLPPTAEF